MRGEYIFELCLFVVFCFVVFMNWWDQRKQEKQSSHLLSDSSRLTESDPRGPRRGVTPQGDAGVVRRGRFSALLSPGQPPLRFPLLEIPRG